MKTIAVIVLGLMLAGCASAPGPSITHPDTSIAHKMPVVKQVSKPVAKTAAPEAKPPTFKERWFDRFMKHKSK